MSLREPVPRRTFLIDAARLAAAGLLTAELQLLVGCARDGGERGETFAHLTTAEGSAMRAFASQIFPSERDLPGAEEAGVVNFVDRAFAMPFFAESAALIRAGLADLDARATSAGARRGFASASDAQQIAIMRALETTPFFVAARTMAIIGMLADPSYGGNRAGSGTSIYAIEHRPAFTAPFGWYDTHPDSSAAPETT